MAQAEPKSTPTPRPKARPGGGKPPMWALTALMVWHGVFAGAFLIAMVSGQVAYAAHAFAGVVLIGAMAVRLLVGAAFPAWHVLAFPWPKLSSLGQGSSGVRRFVSHIMGVVMLVVSALASVTGWYAWSADEAHAAVSYFALGVIGVHVGLVIVMQGVKKVEAFARGGARG